MEQLLSRFYKYVSFDTQSDENSTSCPSTMKQRKLGEYLVEELKKAGIDNAYLDDYGYVYGKVKANNGSDTTIGLISHMDTSPDASGLNVKPTMEVYNGGDLLINKDLEMSISAKSLANHIGHNIIHTDGTTLLGADDKAGVAIIVEVMTYIHDHPEFKHPAINVCFTPDEEVGRGTENFNYEYFKEGTKKLLTYTLDGDEINLINYENFNAASAEVVVHGVSIHPGSAKNVMVNSQLLAMEFNSLLPVEKRPEYTSLYEGFNHLHTMYGDVTTTTLKYIIRNHDMEEFKAQKQSFLDIRDFLNKKYGEGTFEVTLADSYYNMKDIVLKQKEILDLPIEALKAVGIEASFDPIRGGTDGASLSYHGVTCPNLGTGCGNFHGPFEFADYDNMKQMVEAVKKMLELVK